MVGVTPEFEVLGSSNDQKIQEKKFQTHCFFVPETNRFVSVIETNTLSEIVKLFGNNETIRMLLHKR